MSADRFVLNIDTLERIERSVCIMSGTDDAGRRLRVGVDRRYAYDICQFLDSDGAPVPAIVERWQVIGIDPLPAA